MRPRQRWRGNISRRDISIADLREADEAEQEKEGEKGTFISGHVEFCSANWFEKFLLSFIFVIGPVYLVYSVYFTGSEFVLLANRPPTLLLRPGLPTPWPRPTSQASFWLTQY